MSGRFSDGDSSSVTFAHSGILDPTPFSAMCWSRHYSTGGDPGGSGTVLSVWDGSERSWRLTVGDGPLEYRGRVSFTGSDQESVGSNTTIALDVWNHVGMDFDGTDIRFWLNGVVDASSNNPGTIFQSTSDFAVVGVSGGGNQVDVDIEDARVYDRILTVAEWETIFATRGHDAIKNGLLARVPVMDGPPGTLLTAVNPSDIGPNQFAISGIFGSPVGQYIEGPGLSFRRKAG